MLITIFFAFTLFVNSIECLNNGLALTPPMGWMHWQRFRCTIDCDRFPDECISEKLFRDMADRLSSDGYLEAGYEYLIIDDCWMARERGPDGKLQPDPERFPSGIKDLADYVHAKGLKFGIYGDYGTKTCEGYPGSIDHLEIDAQTFAEWEVDYIKVDGCSSSSEHTNDTMQEGYARFGKYLNETGRPMVYSCSFPAYEKLETNYTVAVEVCNLWRNYGDIDDSWNTVKAIADWFSEHQDYLRQFAGPGHWNDPDMLLIGNFGLSYEQSKAQMTMWVILAAPLIMSVDLRTIQPQFREILLNPVAIDIGQDPLGIQGFKLTNITQHVDVWMRPILPIVGIHFSYALGFVNRGTSGFPNRLEFTLKQFELDNPEGYYLTNAFEDPDYSSTKHVSHSELLEVRVPPSGAVLLLLEAVDDLYLQ